MSVRAAIKKFTHGVRVEDEEISACLEEIVRGEATHAQSGAFLSLLATVMPVPSPAVLSKVADLVLSLSPFQPPKNGGSGLVDIVGTGGDGRDAFNVSTAAAFVCAAAGLRLAKHGGRSASGSVGSADLIEQLGGDLAATSLKANEALEACGLAFLFAPAFHPCLARIAPVRKELGIRTVFNLIGPLTNALNPQWQVTGVGSETLGQLFQAVFALRGSSRAIVVHSEDGLDEFSVSAPNTVWEVVGGRALPSRVVTPEDMGLARHPLESVCGGSVQERAERLVALFSRPDEDPALRDFVVANAAPALIVAGAESDWAAAAARCLAALRDGRAAATLARFRALSRPAVPHDDILDRILRLRREDIASLRHEEPACEAQQDRHARDPFPACDFAARLRRAGLMAVIAEVKRASPSKGDIAAGASAPLQALKYARGGAAAVSVLTETRHFQGTLADLTEVRAALGAAYGEERRPAVLRKDFIVEACQVHEARTAGADTVLLIVAALPGTETLSALISLSRSLGMEALVEVNSVPELETALAAGARVIGVNNRNLRTFQVDMATTSLVAAALAGRPDIVLCALSGISSRQDVCQYAGLARAVLIGEYLMLSADPAGEVTRLRGGLRPLAKICGLASPADAVATVRAGAAMIGLVFAPGSKRAVSEDRAREIVAAVRGLYPPQAGDRDGAEGPGWSVQAAVPITRERGAEERALPGRTLVVGVFADQPASEVNRIALAVGLDVIQLSGVETVTDARAEYCLPVIKALHVQTGVTTADSLSEAARALAARGVAAVLLDTRGRDPSVRGGTGEVFDWSIAAQLSESGVGFFLAGGLDPDNVAAAVAETGAIAVDISSGVETAGVKDLSKISAFLKNLLK